MPRRRNCVHNERDEDRNKNSRKARTSLFFLRERILYCTLSIHPCRTKRDRGRCATTRPSVAKKHRACTVVCMRSLQRIQHTFRIQPALQNVVSAINPQKKRPAKLRAARWLLTLCNDLRMEQQYPSLRGQHGALRIFIMSAWRVALRSL